MSSLRSSLASPRRKGAAERCRIRRPASLTLHGNLESPPTFQRALDGLPAPQRMGGAQTRGLSLGSGHLESEDALRPPERQSRLLDQRQHTGSSRPLPPLVASGIDQLGPVETPEKETAVLFPV